MLGRTKTNDLPEGVVVGKEKLSAYNVLVVAILTLGALAGGMPSAIISTTLGQPSFLLYFDLVTKTGLKTNYLSGMNGVFYAGGAIGLVGLSYITDPLGRKNSLRIGAALGIISNALLAGSVHIGMFITFRFFQGVAASICVGTVPVLISEISPPHSRGLMVGIFGAAISSGYSIASWFGVAFYFCHSTNVQWRLPIALCGVPALLILILLPLVPESPRWLLIKGRSEEASRIIRKLHGGEDARVEDFANLELQQMMAQIAFEQQNHVSWVQFLFSRQYSRRAWTAALTFTTSQSAGVLAIVTYAATISASIGYGPVAQLCFSAGYLTLGLFAALVGAMIIDRVGRVTMLVTGTILQIILISIFTALVKLYAGTTNVSANKASIALIFLYFFVYGAFMESATYTYVSELFPSHVRAKGVSFGIMFLFLTDVPFVVGATYGFNDIGWKFYLVFIITPIFMLVGLCLMAKETKGKSLEEIGAIFGDHLVVRTLEEQLEDEKHGVRGAPTIVSPADKTSPPAEVEDV